MSPTAPIINVVDDDASFLAAISRLLRANGFSVKTYRASYDRAKHLALASKMALNQSHQKVALQIYSTYYKLLTAKGQFLAAKAGAEASRDVEDSVKLRLTSGLASTVEVARARAQQRVRPLLHIGHGWLRSPR
jgi:outer membrane protein TolC